jgi:SAM-dependent methyltransferase
MSPGTATAGKADIYDDPAVDYAKFWEARAYEHEAEVIAIRHLLDGHRFATAVDVGGGYGRLSAVLTDYAEQVILTDPSTWQLGLAERLFPGGPPFTRRLMDAAHLRFADGSIDLVTLVRVLNHLPDPEPELAEMARILRPGGYAVIEVANSVNAARRLGWLLHGRPLTQEPVDVRPMRSRRRGGAPDVKHHPGMIAAQLASVGLETQRLLSVSNLRHPLAKAVLPCGAMLAVERLLQRPLGPLYFGASVFFLAQKEASFAHGGTWRAQRPGSAGNAADGLVPRQG